MNETVNNFSNKNAIVCEICGTAIEPGENFCPSCGKSTVTKATKSFCQSCGAELAENVMFCSKCGFSIAQNSSPVVPNPVQYYTQPAVQPIQPPLQPKKRSKKWIIPIIFVVIAAILIGYYVIIEPARKYEQANDYQEAGNYYEAYVMFDELDDYKDSEKELDATVALWSIAALGSEDEYEVQSFCDTVWLDSDNYSYVYSAVVLYINNHTEAAYWYDENGATIPTQNVIMVLNMLPSLHENTATYLELFNAINTVISTDALFSDYASTIEKCWDLGFVQDMAEQDDNIKTFLLGNWLSSSYEDRYFEFYEKDGGISTSYNVPWIAEPAGTKYYNIYDMIYYYLDANSNRLSKVFKFEIVDYNTIRVFSYKNYRTYTMYRS